MVEASRRNSRGSGTGAECSIMTVLYLLFAGTLYLSQTAGGQKRPVSEEVDCRGAKGRWRAGRGVGWS